jgi:hypothetical protein
MSSKSLEDALQTAGSAVVLGRNSRIGPYDAWRATASA